MLRYFVAGNVWLVFAVSAFTGRTFARSEPTMYSIHGLGRWFYPGEYLALVLFLVSVSALFFWFCWLTRRRVV